MTASTNTRKPSLARTGPIPQGIETVRELVMYTMLKIRDKRGRLLRLHLNRAQRDLEKTSGKRNIVLKARQLGVTTYVAARFFVSCITRQGTLERASRARSALRRGNFSHRAPVPGEPAGALRKGALSDLARQCSPDCLPHAR